MPDYLFLMHTLPAAELDWEPYLAKLRAQGRFQGGSAIGGGICVQKAGAPPAPTRQLSGFIRVSARDLDDAKSLVAGNPVFEGGGVVEIRELPTGGAPAHAREAGRQDSVEFEDRAIDGASFRNCSMARSRFDDVRLSASHFTDVDLRDARLDDVNLAGVSITNANIEGLTIFGHDIRALIRAEIARTSK